MPPFVFDSLEYLEILTLHDNAWNDSEQGDYRDDLFRELKNLQRLTLDGIPAAQLGEGFSQLKNLKSLEIFGRVTRIKNDTFENLAGLPIERLNIKSDRNLTWLEPTSFSYFQNLTTLDLGYNRAVNFDQISDAWYGLKFTKIRSLILTRVISPRKQTTNVKAVFYKYLKENHIENLYLDKNNIVITEPGISKHLPYLVHLDMSFNRLSNVGSLIADFGYMKHLLYLDASHQIRRYIGVMKREVPINNVTNKPVHQKNLEEDASKGSAVLPCRMNSGVKLCPPIKKENGSYPVEERGPWCFIFPPRLETFNLTSSLSVELQFMPQLIGLGGFHLKEILYRSNGIQYLSGPFILSKPNPSIPLIADFSGNGLTCIAVDLFKWVVKKGGCIGKLFLSSNNLAAQMAEDTSGEVFKYYSNLTELRLDKNGIKNLPFDIFCQVSNLQLLNLSGNSLRLLEFNFANMEKLQTLDISDNLITNIFSDTLDKLNAIMKRSNLHVNLRGNPILCSCESLEFLRWILDRNHKLVDFSQYVCIYGDNSVTFDKLATIILPDLSFKCSTKTALLVSAWLLALVIVVVGIAVVAYRLRWDIHVCFLRFRTRRKDFVDYEESRRNYQYDAFVIYDKDDQWWIQEELEPNLCRNSLNQESEETKANDVFRLCIHGKDFPIGEPIVQNIMSSIEKSRKIVVVLSPNFLESKWCGYELELSHLENVSRGINTIIPLILQPFEARRNMSPILKSILRNRTYLEWPNHVSGQAEFWRQLTSVLRPNIKDIDQ